MSSEGQPGGRDPGERVEITVARVAGVSVKIKDRRKEVCSPLFK